MNGEVRYPMGQRERQQFVTTNLDMTQRTYSRGCTIVRGDFVLVRVPLDAEGNDILEELSPDKRRFVEHNITPAEWADAERRSKK